MFKLGGKVVLLSGADGFFGPFFAAALLEAGAKVLAVGKAPVASGPYGQQFRDMLLAANRSEQFVEHLCDYYDEERTRETYADVAERSPRINVLINNAFDFSVRTGFNDQSGRFENISREQFMAGMESGVWWAARATQCFAPRMKAQGSGIIINTCSMYAVVVPDVGIYEGSNQFNPPTYSAAKHALWALTKYTASFFGPEVRANALSPGAIPRFDESFHGHQKGAPNPLLEKLTAKTLLKRMGHPSDLVGALLFLASDASAYITGQNLVIDGGITTI